MEMRAPFIDKIAYFLEKRGEVVTDPLIGLTGLEAEMSYFQIWCLRLVCHAAIWSGLVVSIPSLKVTPVMTLAR
jgi:hypothetical protein